MSCQSVRVDAKKPPTDQDHKQEDSEVVELPNHLEDSVTDQLLLAHIPQIWNDKIFF